MHYNEYKAMSTSEFQEKLRYHNIVIHGMPTDTVNFDESGLLELTNLDSKINFQGGSMICIFHIKF
jgi:hypothetical protein